MQWDPEHLAELQGQQPAPAGLDPPFLKDASSPVTAADAAAVEAAEARAHGGHAPKGGFAAAAQVGQVGQKAAAANWRAGFTEEPTAREMLAAVQEMHPAAEELPTIEEARALQAVEQEELGHNPKGGMAAKVLSAAQKADLAMKRAIQAGGFTDESAALLMSAESKLYGQVLPGGVASQVASFAKQNREAGLSPAYHPRHRWEQRRRQDGGGSPRAGQAGAPRAAQAAAGSPRTRAARELPAGAEGDAMRE